MLDQQAHQESSIEVCTQFRRPLTPGVRDAAVDRISSFLSLADDLENFYRIGYGDVDFAPVLQRLYGLHR